MATREEIYLASLLHDIGKFMQRADENGLDRSKKINPEVKKLQDIYCPLNKDGFSHKHVLWTAQFIEDNKNILGQVLSRSSCGTVDELMKLASRHHNPEDIFQKIIQKADNYSAGMDRTCGEAWKDAADESNKNWDAFKSIQMRSIFEIVGKRNPDLRTAKKIPFSPLEITEKYITYSDDNNDNNSYKKLWESFNEEFLRLQGARNIKSFSETLLYLLYKYTTRIPASTQNYPDVSLYDHLKTTAGFAIALYDYVNEKNNFESLPSSREKPFLLIGGDLSGIQNFIYGIVAHRAAKNLKGRSFYLQLLVESVAAKLIEELSLTESSIIYQSGGGFYMVAPNTESIIEKINKFIKKLEENLFKYHGTQLYFSIGYESFGEEEIFGNVSDLWEKLAKNINQNKKKKFQSIIQSNYDLLFGNDVTQINNNLGRDYITGEPLKDKCKLLDENDEGSKVNEYTYKQIELGKRLKDAHYWIVSSEKIKYWREEDFCFDPIDLGCYNYLIGETELKEKQEILKGSADKVKVRVINNLNFTESIAKGIDNIYGFVFYGGNDYPRDEHAQPFLFEELAGVKYADYKKTLSKSSPELVRLGILRMDVDNLGDIFQKGIDRQYCSFSRFASLSRSLDLFFSGFLNTLWRSNNDYKQYTQIIYAGGDDLFIVGKWDVLINFAKKIHELFTKWTCKNDSISISGGLAVVPPKFPLLKAAILSENEEKNAKKHVYNDRKKNAFSIFGYSFEWDHEFEYVMERKDDLKDFLEKGLPGSFPSDMYNYMSKAYPEKTGGKEMKLSGKYADNTYRYRMIWLIAYNFHRASLKYKNNEEIKNFYINWEKYIFSNKIDNLEHTSYHAIQILAIAARWASFEFRSEIKKE